MKYFKKHKTTTLAIIIFIVGVLLLNFVYNKFFIKKGSPKYGDRLDGIEEVIITDEDNSNMINSIKKNSDVLDVSVNLSGKTLNIVITVKDNLSIDDAKSIGKASFDALNDNQINYYDIQVFLKKNDSTKNNFPIIGYKHKNTTKVKWTKNREVTKTNENK